MQISWVLGGKKNKHCTGKNRLATSTQILSFSVLCESLNTVSFYMDTGVDIKCLKHTQNQVLRVEKFGDGQEKKLWQLRSLHKRIALGDRF